MLAFYDYKERYDPSTANLERNAFIHGLESVFAYVFLLEFIVKIIGRGFLFGEGTYLKSGWCILDFLTLVSRSLFLSPSLSLTPSSLGSQLGLLPNISVLRVIRIVRLVRFLKLLPGKLLSFSKH